MAFVQGFAGGGRIGDVSPLVLGASSAVMIGQGMPVPFFAGKAGCSPMNPSGKNSYPAITLSFAERAQSDLAPQSIKANLAEKDLPARRIADQRALGRAA